MASAWQDLPGQVIRIPSRLLGDMYYDGEPEAPNPGIAKSAFDAAATANGVFKLRVLSQNIFGVPVKPFVTERVAAFASPKIFGKYDVIAFQELVHRRERDLISKAAREAGFVYSHHFAFGIGFPGYRRTWGGGLVVISRYPIVEALYNRYTRNGKPYKVHHADYGGAKGCALLRILTPGGVVDVYTTHLIAFYTNDPRQHPEVHDEYHVDRLCQAVEMAQFIRSTARSNLVIMMGDLNSTPCSLVVRFLRGFAGLQDAHYPGSPWEADDGEPTYMSKDNSFYTSKGDAPLRIDYVLYRLAGGWKHESAAVAKDYAAVNGKTVSVSDHFGVSAVFSFDFNAPSTGKDTSGYFDSLFSADPNMMAVLDLAEEKLVHEKAETLKRQKNHRHQALACFIAILLVLALEPFTPFRNKLVELLLAMYGVFQLVFGFATTMEDMSSVVEVHKAVRLARTTCSSDAAKLWSRVRDTTACAT